MAPKTDYERYIRTEELLALQKRTADPYVQEQLLRMVANLDQVIAALRSVTFDLVPDSLAALELVPEPPGSEPPAA